MGFGQEFCIKAKLVAKRPGRYTVYVFQDADKENSYIMCTKCPNWDGPEVEIFQDGFLTYKFVIAGQDSWLNKESGSLEAYQYTANYFINFIPITHVLSGQVVEELKIC